MVLKRLAGRLGLERPRIVRAGQTEAERDAARRGAEAVVRERATREAVAYQEILADIVIRTLGIASAITARDVHEHIVRILAGGGGAAFLEGVAGELRRRRVTLAGTIPGSDHLAACLCSPMISRLVERRLQPMLRAEVAGDDPDD